MLKAALAVSATAVLLTACGNNEPADAPVEGPAVSSAEAPMNPAVDTRDTSEQAALTPGANSFTEGQAKSAIEKAGYGNVTELKKDDNGVWRGKASKSGVTSSISVDFQGNVNAAK